MKTTRIIDLRLLSGRWLSPSMADLNGSSSLPAAWQRLAEEALAEAAAERTWTAWSSEGDVSLGPEAEKLMENHWLLDF